MADTCTFPSDRNETLAAYLYDDIEPAERAAFEAHLTACDLCRDEVRSLRGVRQQLASWAPPERTSVDNRPSTLLGATLSPSKGRLSIVDKNVDRPLLTGEGRPSTAKTASWLPDIPGWAQAAAAVLVLGAAAGIANLDVHYDRNGFIVRTGWSKPAAAVAVAPALATTPEPARADAVSRAELVALEQRLRGEVRALQSSAHAVAAGDAQLSRASSGDADLMRRVRAMIDDNDKRQQRELALRVGEVIRDVNAQRQADLVRIDHSLGLMENNLGVEVLKQRERVNYLLRVNQRQ